MSYLIDSILEKLGSGEFGEVCKALWTISGATKELAIKTLRPELPEEEKVRFLQEAAIMGQFSHPNVVKLYGVVTVGEPVSCCCRSRDIANSLYEFTVAAMSLLACLTH